MKTIDRTDLHAVRVLGLDTVIGNDVGHDDRRFALCNRVEPLVFLCALLDKGFALFPLGCISAGAAGAAIHVAWLAMPWPLLLQLSIAVGVWLYLIPLIVAVSHRMIPFSAPAYCVIIT